MTESAALSSGPPKMAVCIVASKGPLISYASAVSPLVRARWPSSGSMTLRGTLTPE